MDCAMTAPRLGAHTTLVALEQRDAMLVPEYEVEEAVEDGVKLLEHNVRFGDPECQVLMMRLKSDLVGALVATVDGVLDRFNLRWYDDASLTVVLAANGYPGSYEKGTKIKGVEAAEAAKIKQVPSSLAEALEALEADHDFLLKGGVFTPDLLETWISTKTQIGKSNS